MNGILFKPDMHRAIREMKKTVTRRLMNPQPFIPMRAHPVAVMELIRDWQKKHESRYHADEIVYIKETWSIWRSR